MQIAFIFDKQCSFIVAAKKFSVRGGNRQNDIGPVHNVNRTLYSHLLHGVGCVANACGIYKNKAYIAKKKTLFDVIARGAGNVAYYTAFIPE